MSKSHKSLHYAERRIEVFSHPGWDERHPAVGSSVHGHLVQLEMKVRV